MKLATFQHPDLPTSQPGGTFAAVITETTVDDAGAEVALTAVQIPQVRDVGELLAMPEEQQQKAIDDALGADETLAGPTLDVSQLNYATLVPFPTKVFCIGLNYRNHIVETGNEIPEYPTIFTKFGLSLTSATADIPHQEVDHRLDYEGELCVVVGTPGRNIAEEDAAEHIAGYAISNDVSLRGYQGRTPEWTQGKIFEGSTPVGPWLVTADEHQHDARLTTLVNGEVRQNDLVSDLVFSPAELVAYISKIVTLLPGDMILTGTPGGVALAMRNSEGRHPWLTPGDTVETRIEGLGAQHNTIV